MPGITLRISGQPDADLTRRAVARITSVTCTLLDKKPQQTVAMVQYIPQDQWFIAGKSLVEHGKNSFRLEVTITDETCTKWQKAEYQEAAFAALSDVIGNVHPHSNVHVIDCRASAYGYGGVTQEHRYQHQAQPSAAPA
ncbi:MAG: 4-oxalocrotonate tautomerase family protein [Afipia sp.]|nr:MAG: 4-oxalocrotonate tautomerase family protein [Afipia sp.]